MKLIIYIYWFTELLDCPNDVILYIISFLDDKSKINMISTCKDLYDMDDKIKLSGWYSEYRGWKNQFQRGL